MKLVRRDCGDYFEISAVGVAICRGGTVLVSGPEIPDELKRGRTWLSIPLILFKIPKKQPTDMPVEQWKEQNIKEYMARFNVAFTEACKKCKKGGMMYGEKSTVRNETVYGVWAHNMDDQEPQSNSLAVEELSSELDKLYCSDEVTGSLNEFKADNMEK